MEHEYALGRRPVLDGVRGVAVLLVILGHGLGHEAGGPATAGVTTFFVLSGFLITRLLLEEHRSNGSLDLRGFYARRAWRLVPALLLLLAFCAVLATTGAMSWTPIIVAATYTTDLAPFAGIGTGLLGHTWSLSLEEQFYLVWPLLLLPVVRHRSGRLLLVVVACCSALLRVLLVHDHASALDYAFRPDTRVDALLVGCLLGLTIERFLKVRWLNVAALTAVLGYGTLASFTGWSTAAALILPLALLSAVVIAWGAGSPNGWGARVLSHPVLRWTGRISYGMYLWQSPVVVACHGLPTGLRLVVAVVGSYILATLSWYAVERPILLRHRRTHKRHAPAGEAPASITA